MKNPIWFPQKLSVGAIMDAVEQTKAQGHWIEIRQTQSWTNADTYLMWAKDAVSREDTFGWDAGVVYAKRAACRQIDALMVSNHVGGYLQKKSYPAKVEILNEIGIEIPGVVHDLIIDPRNNVEHAYELASKKQAQHAVEVCKMFLTSQSMADESWYGMIVSLGLVLNSSFRGSNSLGKERKEYEFELPDHAEQSVLVDYYLPDPRIFVLRPQEQELLHCPMSEFTITDLKKLAIALRQERKQSSEGKSHLQERVFPVLRQDLGLNNVSL